MKATDKATRPTVLVVDDEPEVVRSVHDLLRLDYRVLTCTRGADAVRVLEGDEPVRVVMSDQRMPGMTGVEVLAHAGRLRPEATRLLFTAYADIRAVIDAINEGRVWRYVTKPWDPDELQATVRQAVAQHDMVAERNRLLRELRETNRRLVEADRLKSAFIEVASHELNTPVAVVTGLAQLWKLTQGDHASDPERQWVERIHAAGRRLAHTVERMLKLVRSEELNRPVEVERTALVPLIHEVVAGVAPFLAARKQTVDLEVPDDLGEAELDAAKVGDVLTNLLANAIKFSPDGGTVRLAARADGPDFVRFEVADQGQGMPPDVRAHLFEPFFTGFDTLHHSSGDFGYGKRGMGLGLCLVKRFVDLHGGTVEVTSEPGSGSVFAFTLPRKPPALNGASHEPSR